MSCTQHNIGVGAPYPEEAVDTHELVLVAHRGFVPDDEAAVSQHLRLGGEHVDAGRGGVVDADGYLEGGVRRLAALEAEGRHATARHHDDAVSLPTRLVRHRVDQVGLA